MRTVHVVTSTVGQGSRDDIRGNNNFLVCSWSERDHGVVHQDSSKLRCRISLCVELPIWSSSLPAQTSGRVELGQQHHQVQQHHCRRWRVT